MYNRKLTNDQKEAIRLNAKKARLIKVESREKKAHKNDLISLGRPKRPMSTFLMFIEEQQKKSPVKGNLTVYYKDKWSQLSDQQKQPYVKKYEALSCQYK